MSRPAAQSPSVFLVMAIHCHQPVGNFGFVFEEAFRKAYEPFLAVLERHPAIRLSLHYSGSLLDWLQVQQPRFLDRVARLARAGQVELLGGGYYEPILPIIPEADRQGQIAMMREALRRHFGVEARGLWLTERVWEPELPRTLMQAGVAYTMLDTNQFAGARSGLPASLQAQDHEGWDLLGAYLTEHDGASVGVFPASKRLRYWLPFQEPARTVEWLRRLTRLEPLAVTFADDGEKFGLWPKTFRWVHEQGWLERFFSALERESSWLKTSTFGEYWDQTGPSGRVYLPCGSYEEMLEWSGGYFRNFFVKYPEANAMRQKMLHVSQRLQQCTVDSGQLTGKTIDTKRKKNITVNRKLFTVNQLLAQARRELYMAQCNCAYWHGVFGGLYLSHLRRPVYSHLIAAERLVQVVEGRTAPITVEDVDGDGRPEVVLRNPWLSVTVDPGEGGTVTELDDLRRAVNLIDTLSRRHEPYHEKLKAARSATGPVTGSTSSPAGIPPARSVGSPATADTPSAAERVPPRSPASIHDLVNVKEAGLETRLTYDDHRRSCGLEYAFTTMPTLQQVVRSTWGEHRLWSGGAWNLVASRRRGTAVTLERMVDGGTLRKTIRLSDRRPQLQVQYQVLDTSVPVVALEFNVCLRDEERLEPRWESGVMTYRIQDSSLGIALTMSSDVPMTLATFPIETVSESEEGLERTYQGLALVCLWETQNRSPWACALDWTLQGMN